MTTSLRLSSRSRCHWARRCCWTVPALPAVAVRRCATSSQGKPPGWNFQEPVSERLQFAPAGGDHTAVDVNTMRTQCGHKVNH